MGFAPKSGGEVPPYRFIPSEPKTVNISEKVIEGIKGMAHDLWERVTSDERISDALHDYLSHGNPIDLM